MGIVLCVKSERHATYFDGNASVTTVPFATGRFEGERRGGDGGEEGWLATILWISSRRVWCARVKQDGDMKLPLRTYTNTHIHIHTHTSAPKM